VCPDPSLTVMLTAEFAVLAVGSVTVNVPFETEGEVTVTSDVFELVAVNELTPVSLAVKVAE